ncbi:hypothetical protein [Bacillus infantis]|nr:hypothetical protein [Bacillus infantis]
MALKIDLESKGLILMEVKIIVLDKAILDGHSLKQQCIYEHASCSL